MPKVTKQSPKKPAAATGSILSRIAPIEVGDELKILLYGKSGTGKTTLAGSFPGKLLWIVCSGGKRPGELKSLQAPEYVKKVEQVVLFHSDELKELIPYLESSTDKYRTVVLDHVSGLQDKILAEILDVEELPVQKSWGMATQQQYGQCTQQVKEYLRRLLGLSCNLVVIGQERVFKPDENDAVSVMEPFVSVALTPSLAGWLAPACDYVCQTLTRQKTITKTGKLAGKEITTVSKAPGVDYLLRTMPHETYASKFRVPKGYSLPEFIVDPTYDKIQAILKGEYQP